MALGLGLGLGLGKRTYWNVTILNVVRRCHPAHVVKNVAALPRLRDWLPVLSLHVSYSSVRCVTSHTSIYSADLGRGLGPTPRLSQDVLEYAPSDTTV